MTKKIIKRSGAIAIAAVVGLSFVPTTALTVFADEVEAPIICDISQGNVTISGDAISYVGTDGTAYEDVDISSDSHIIITGTTDKNTIMVRDWDDSPLDITFQDLTIDVTAVPAEETGFISACAAYFGGESGTWAAGTVNLTLEGTNTLKSADYAGIAVPMGETLTIDGTGTLNVESKRVNANVTAPAIGAPVSDVKAPAYILGEEYDTNFGTIIIKGGTINATSEDTGIGGGQYSLGGTILITGGNVTAKATSSSAAGIGCGQDGQFGSITITGGEVTATGSNAGSGIGGGGMHTDSGVITITGGKVTAQGGNYGAGIGGANTGISHGDANVISISGGDVTAIGGFGAAGIGGGATASCFDTINISGGTVNAQGGAAQVTVGDHMSFDPATRTRTVDGTQTRIYCPGAGIGNAGAYYALVSYTSGTKSGSTSESQSANFGGTINITGGTVISNGGVVSTDEEEKIIEDAGIDLIAAQGVGNGAYVNLEETALDYKACDITIEKANVTDNGTALNTLYTIAVKAISNQVYTGEAVEPAVKVYANNKKLKAGRDYTIEYSDNVEIGTATIVVEGIGNYVGKQILQFNILPKTTAASSITVGKNKMTVQAKTVLGADAYKIYYKVKGTSTWNVATAGASGKATIKNLKSGKKYVVKVVSLAKSGNKTFRSAKTSVKKVSEKIK